MRLRKSGWFRIIVAELKQRGFTPGGMACPNIVSSYQRNGVTIELRGGHMLRVLRRGQDCEYDRLDLAAVIRIIEQAMIHD